MSYFIGVLIVVAILATADPAFAADNSMLVDEAINLLLYIFGSFIVIASMLGVMIFKTKPLFANWIPPRHERNGIFGLIWGIIFGVIWGVKSGAVGSEIMPWITLGAILGSVLGILFGDIFDATWGFILGVILSVLMLTIIAFVHIMLEADWDDKIRWLTIFSDLLGIQADMHEKENTLIRIGTIAGGLLAAITLITIYFHVKAQEQNNILIKKGQDEDLFRFTLKELQSTNPGTLISAFRQFYCLAKHHHVADFKKNIFDVLCDYLHDINRPESKIKTHHYKGMPTDHYQKLLDVLFMSDDNPSIGLRTRLRLSKACPYLFANINPLFPFAKFNIKLKNVNFMNVCLSNAHFTHGIFENVDFTGANLEKVDFRHAEFTNTNLKMAANAKGANFHKVIINKKPISSKELPRSCKKEYDANLIFWMTVIFVEVVFGLLSLIFIETSSYWENVFRAILSITIGMSPGVILGTYLSDYWIKQNSEENQSMLAAVQTPIKMPAETKPDA